MSSLSEFAVEVSVVLDWVVLTTQCRLISSLCFFVLLLFLFLCRVIVLGFALFFFALFGDDLFRGKWSLAEERKFREVIQKGCERSSSTSRAFVLACSCGVAVPQLVEEVMKMFSIHQWIVSCEPLGRLWSFPFGGRWKSL